MQQGKAILTPRPIPAKRMIASEVRKIEMGWVLLFRKYKRIGVALSLNQTLSGTAVTGYLASEGLSDTDYVKHRTQAAGSVRMLSIDEVSVHDDRLTKEPE